MKVAVVGTGFIGGTLGRALANSGHEVVFGSRHPEADDVAVGTKATVATIGEALDSPDVVLLAVPAQAVDEIVADHGVALSGRLVVDTTNKMGADTVNCRSNLPADIRYARAFNTLGGENLAEPRFSDGPADLFFSGPEGDRGTLESLIGDVGLRPIYVGEDNEDIIDGLFRRWIALAWGQGRGRRLALRLLEG